jgi:hypothetical protein
MEKKIKFSNSLNSLSGKKLNEFFSLFRFKSLESQENNNSTLIPISENIPLIENPCYLRGYFSESKTMKGTGEYKRCYDVLATIITNGQQLPQKSSESQEEKFVK